jgi:hypothetical protein
VVARVESTALARRREAVTGSRFTTRILPPRVAAVPLSEQQLTEDLTRAMKAREMPRVYVLRGLLTAVKNMKVEKRSATLAESDLVQLVRREIRQRDEAADFASRAGRLDVVEQNRAEKAILAGYVPAQLTEEELEVIIRAMVAKGAPQSLGAVMAALREQHAGRFDGKTASDLARRILGGSAQS